jgi:FKBP-type peptidyl-prolyl cis-trans isomerase 2
VLLAVAALAACGRQPPDRVQLGSQVLVDFTMKIDDRVADSTKGDQPRRLVIGLGALPVAAEYALIGLRAGESREITLKPAQAYGERDAAEQVVMPRRRFDGLNSPIKEGMAVYGLRQGKPARASVVKVEGDRVVLDFGHRYAGKPATFELSVVEIQR